MAWLEDPVPSSQQPPASQPPRVQQWRPCPTTALPSAHVRQQSAAFAAHEGRGQVPQADNGTTVRVVAANSRKQTAAWSEFTAGARAEPAL